MTKRTAVLLTALLTLFALPVFASPESDLRTALTNYRQALVKKDLLKLEQVWAPDYTFIDSHGRVQTKAQRMADLKSSATTLDSITHQEEPKIHVHGDVGIITSIVTITGQYNGRKASGEYRSTHIWINTGGHWWLLMNQLTLIEK